MFPKDFQWSNEEYFFNKAWQSLKKCLTKLLDNENTLFCKVMYQLKDIRHCWYKSWTGFQYECRYFHTITNPFIKTFPYNLCLLLKITLDKKVYDFFIIIYQWIFLKYIWLYALSWCLKYWVFSLYLSEFFHIQF